MDKNTNSLENNTCAHSVYQALSPSLKRPGDEARAPVHGTEGSGFEFGLSW